MTGEITAHHLASEIARRWMWAQSLGRPSLYNIAREVLCEAFEVDGTIPGEPRDLRQGV